MELLILIAIFIGICWLIGAILPILLPFILIAGIISIVARIIRAKQDPTNTSDDTSTYSSYSSQNNGNVIDVEYTEREDDEQ